MEQNFFNVLISVAGAAVAWFIKVIYDQIKELKFTDERLADSVDEIKENYARRDDVHDFVIEIKATLLRIENKLDGKVDK